MADFDQRIFDTLTKTERQLYLRFDHLLELGTDQLADFMGCKKGTIHSQVCSGEFPIPTYKRGRRLVASLKHVALYQDNLEREAVARLVKTHGSFDQARGQQLARAYADR